MTKHCPSQSVKYLRVVADMPPDSIIMPIKVIFDEREFIIDKVFDIKRVTVPAVGEFCNAYYCKFGSKIRILYLSKDCKWFVI